METAKYKKIDDILDNVIRAAESAKRECQKTSPNHTKVCQLAYENLESLLSQIGTYIFSDCFDMG